MMKGMRAQLLRRGTGAVLLAVPPLAVPLLTVPLLTVPLLVAPADLAAARLDVDGPTGAVFPAAAGVPAARPLPPTPGTADSSVGYIAAAGRAPAFASRVPRRTTQVVRTVRSRRWCADRWCSITQAWRKDTDGRWRQVRRMRSTIGSQGFDKRREGDARSPSGVFPIKATFSTREHSPGSMPWRRRRPTSIITNRPTRLYNTWIEEPGRTDGDRPSMRYGFVVGYNRPRLRVGVGRRPVIGKGSGILYHTSRPGQRWIPTLGCTQVGNPRQMRWLVRWLRPDAHPRVVQDL